MSLRLEMLQVARLAPRVLGDSAALVAEFIRRQQADDGGFKDRSGGSDLYYTVFGVEALLALQAAWDVNRTAGFLRRFGDGDGLDFVHLCCLARSWAGVESAGIPGLAGTAAGERLARRLAEFRSADGRFNVSARAPDGTAYGAFLGVGAHQDLRLGLPQPDRLVTSLAALAPGDGGWANETGIPFSGTNSTAAAVVILQNLGQRLPEGIGAWLLQQAHAQGGFVAVPGAIWPDLLSTATAVHALAALEVSLDPVREACLDFVDTLWTNDGGFHGHWADETLDAEYTYYGLLALGHLAV